MEGEKLKVFIKSKRMTQRDLGEKLEMSQQALNYHLKRERFSAEFMKKLENLFGKNFLYPERIRQIDLVEDPNEPYRSIPYYSHAEAYATISPALSDEVAFKKETFYKIPHFERADAMIRVAGHSMKGKINDGDYVIIRKINDIDRILYGEIYYVITKANNLKTVKYLKKHNQDDRYLWLVPYNIEQFEPQEIEKEDIMELYKVEGGVAIY